VRDEALEVGLARGRVELHEVLCCEGEQVVLVAKSCLYYLALALNADQDEEEAAEAHNYAENEDKVGRDGGVGEPADGEVVLARVEGDEGADGEPEREIRRRRSSPNRACTTSPSPSTPTRTRRKPPRHTTIEVRDEALEVGLARGRVELHEVLCCEGEQVVDRERHKAPALWSRAPSRSYSCTLPPQQQQPQRRRSCSRLSRSDSLAGG
jgi:hypothetical protein